MAVIMYTKRHTHILVVAATLCAPRVCVKLLLVHQSVYEKYCKSYNNQKVIVVLLVTNKRFVLMGIDQV